MNAKRLFMAAAAVLCMGTVATAQSTQRATQYFEGAVVYANTYDGKLAEGLNELEAPSKMDMYFKEGDFIVRMYDSGYPKTLLYINDSNRMYQVDLENKRAFAREKFKRKPKDVPTAVALGDSQKIAGYMCYGYRFMIAERKASKRAQATPGRTVTLYISPKLRVNLDLYKGKDRSQAYFLVNGIQGCIPLKVISKSRDITITNTAVAVRREKFDAEQFRLPKGIKIYRGADYRR